MFKSRSLKLGVVGILVGCLLVMGSVAGWAAEQEPRYGGTIRWADNEIPPSLDPHHNMGYGSLEQYIAFNKLINYDPATLEVKPELAVSWEIPNNTTYIFHLRKGVKFQDGSKFNAEVVKWNFERMLSDYSQVADRFKVIDKVKVVDEYTVKFILKKPFAPFLDNLIADGYIVSKQAVEKLGNDGFQKHPVGTGPFEFVKWDKQKGLLVFERFDEYWGKKPYLDKWTFVEIPEPQTRVAALRVGDVDVLEIIPEANVEEFKKSPKFKTLSRLGTSNTIDYLTFNCARPPFDDVRVRKAVALALNENKIVEFLPNTEPIYGPLPPGSWGADPTVGDPPYDPEEAKELLTEAGYPNRFEVTLKIWSNDPSRANLAQIVQSMLAKIGIKVKIQVLEASTLIEQMRVGGAEAKWEFASLHWGGGGALDPNGNLRVLFHSEMGQYNWIANYSNPRVDELLDKALVTVGREKRKELYQEAYKIITSEYPMIWFGRFLNYMAWRPYVHGIPPLRAIGYFPYQVENVWVEKSE